MPAWFVGYALGIGELPEWLRSGLQNRLHGFKSRTRLHVSRMRVAGAQRQTLASAGEGRAALARVLQRLGCELPERSD